MKLYTYVGPSELCSLASPTRCHIQTPTDVRHWAEATHQQRDAEHDIVATFIVDTQYRLWLADRHSEHVACAVGRPVLAAGEITFRLPGEVVVVSAITNQSTGYCPEPTCWNAVAVALGVVGLPHPKSFTTEFHFRRCLSCRAINLVKDGWFVCALCDADLDTTWNFESSGAAKI